MKANELAFFGKIAASVTHELRNVLAVINETNGLMADLLAMMREAPFPHREKFQRSVQKIEEQVRRGVEITSRFNRFAHSMDHACADIDLNSILTQTVSLAQRLAALRNVELKGAGLRSPDHAFYQRVQDPDGFDQGHRGIYRMYERQWLYFDARKGRSRFSMS